MTPTSTHRFGHALLPLWPLCAVLSVALVAQASFAASTDLSSEPLATRPTVLAKPNLMFILDNSGSMNWSYMPDELGVSTRTNDDAYLNWYGYYSSQCNGVAFDPNGSYPPPLDATGNSYANASFTAAKPDGYSSSGGTTDLTSAYYYAYTATTKQPAMGWTYSNGSVDTGTPFYTECSAKIISSNGDQQSPGTSGGSNSNFTKVLLSTQSAAVQQAYANWYSYYRKRYLLMRTAMGRAMKAIDSGYRVGFTTISDTGVTDGSNAFRDVKVFDTTQKANFYSSLYSVSPNGGTPLRAALSKVGRYYANQITGQAYDPVEYSCQRNYALLSTDGYWNGAAGYQLNGSTAIGQQDGTEDRPMRDNTTITTNSAVVYTSPQNAPATRNNNSNTQTRTSIWSRKSTTVSSTPEPNGKNKGLYAVTAVTQTFTETQTQRFSTPQTATASFTRTTVSTDDASTPTSTDSAVTYGAWQNGTTTVTATDNGAPTGTSTWTNATTTTTYQAAKGSGVTTYTAPTQASWGSWSPSSPTYTATTANPGNLANYVPGTPSVSTTTSGGSSNTLADTAEYYYNTDLRNSSLSNCTSTTSGTSQDVCTDIVRPTATDPNTKQHMNTYTIGLGVSGTLPYDRNYLTQTVGTYASLKSGALKWPTPSNTGSGGSEDARNVDDLWHAAVNGRGQYYSALNATALSDAINGVINDVNAVMGSASAASTSALELVTGNNNQVYQASYTTVAWTGDLQAFTLNGDDGTIGTTPVWSAQLQLDAKAPSTRNIYFRGSSGTLQSFTYNNLSSTQQGLFDNLCSKTGPAPAQCAGLSTSDQTVANTGANLVNFLRGDRTYESSTIDSSNRTVAALYRHRDHVLGDIVSGAPVHVAKPPFSYADSGYASFASTNANRKPVVYVGANDGMLHAISADTADGGTELWAYVPGQVMVNMYKLADTNYPSRHQYFVDGAPVMGDIKVGGTWKTILVGGFNAGGRGYYALDITDPASPKTLWEFTDGNMGLSFGNPVITKRKDGTWVVAFSSGYNNSGGDGLGHLYVVNANTGALQLDIPTTAGSSGSPSGLSKINAWVQSGSDNTASRFYGGDLQGNLWRFDVDNLVAPNQAAMQLAKFQIDASTPQPITTKPEPIEVSGQPGVVVATGKYLGAPDITDATQQSIYAVKDTLTATGWGDVRADTTNFVRQTLTATGTTASVTTNPVSWTTKAGWWLDLPHNLERVATNLALQFNTLAIATAIPNGDACASGGSSWRYYLDVTSGSVVTTNPAGMQWSSSSLIVGMSWVKDANGNVRIIYQNSDGSKREEIPPTAPPAGAGSAHRTSWRELTN